MSEGNNLGRHKPAILGRHGLLHLRVPLLDPRLQAGQLPLSGRHAQVVPEPAGDGADDAIDDVASGIRVERLAERGVERANDLAELGLRDAGRVQDLGVEVGKGGREVAVEEPVAAHADDAGGGVLGRVDGHVRVEVRVARVLGAPFLAHVALDVVAHDGRVGRRQSGADAVTGRDIGQAGGILVAAALQVSGKGLARAVGSRHV